jgi:hypothetical protein
LGGREDIQNPIIKSSEDLLDVKGGSAVSELLFFIVARVTKLVVLCPEGGEVYRIEPWLRGVQEE